MQICDVLVDVAVVVAKAPYCFLETEDRMHNEVGTCAEILPI